MIIKEISPVDRVMKQQIRLPCFALRICFFREQIKHRPQLKHMTTTTTLLVLAHTVQVL